MNKEKIRTLAHLTAVGIGAVGTAYVTLRFIIPVSLPFLIAWAIAFVMRAPSRFIAERTRISERATRLILTVLFLLLLLFAVCATVFFVSSELWSVISGFGEGERLKSFISRIFESGGIIENFLPGLEVKLSDMIFELAKNLISGAFSIVSSIAEGIPGAFLFAVVTVISCIYFALDLEGVNATVLRVLPPSAGAWLRRFKRGFLRALLKFARCYALLFLSTFVLVFLGFIILGVPYAFLLSAVIAFFDLLPIIGTGTFLIPFSAVDFIIGNTGRAVGTLLLFVIQTVVRQFLEPRILGKNLGVHPIVTLILIFVGYSLFGFFGILTVPVATAVIEVLFKEKNSAEVEKLSVTE